MKNLGKIVDSSVGSFDWLDNGGDFAYVCRYKRDGLNCAGEMQPSASCSWAFVETLAKDGPFVKVSSSSRFRG